MFELSIGSHVRRELDMRKVDLESSISQAIHEVAFHAEEKQIRITVSVVPPNQPLVFDPAKIEQVLINLLENACKFTPKRGAIELAGYPVVWRNQSRPGRQAAVSPAAGAAANAYRIDVRDSGCGIPAQHIESIFEEYTSYGGGKDRSGGGLGLAICRMIVNAHHGSIWAESGEAGTQFSVVLPYATPASEDIAWMKAEPAAATAAAHN
jgi:signal transduction histidine kinase